MPRTAISGLVCITFLVLLGFPAVPQEPAGKGSPVELARAAGKSIAQCGPARQLSSACQICY